MSDLAISSALALIIVTAVALSARAILYLRTVRIFRSRYRAKGHFGGVIGIFRGPWWNAPSRRSEVIPKLLLSRGRFGISSYYPELALGFRGTAIDIGPISIHWHHRK